MKILKQTFLCASIAAVVASCGDKASEGEVLTASGLNPKDFQTEVNGKKTDLYTLKNANGMEVCVTNFGGRIVSIMAPDKDGQMKDVVLGFDSIADYINIPSDFGAAIGRYANRIDHGKLVIDTASYQLPTNNIDNPAYATDSTQSKFLHTLHGGPTGWQYQVYDVKEVNDSSIILVMNSPDGDNNFPGNVVAEVTYTLTSDNAVDIAYNATTDKPTVINMTNHSYFNLNGDPTTPITNCVLQVNASEYTPVDSTFMTTGEIATVTETPFDFTQPKVVGEEIDAENQQVKYGMGYDHNWVLDTKGDLTKEAVVLKSPVTGITLTVYTDEPGIQVYTGNFLDGSVTGKNNTVYNKRAAICLETQHYPDSPNKPQWPSVVLRPGETYTSHCVYKFGVEK